MNQFEDHYVNRSNWIRAAVLGANDGILSVSSIAVGVASATGKVEPIAIASLAGLVAGALSMGNCLSRSKLVQQSSSRTRKWFLYRKRIRDFHGTGK